MVKTLCFLLWAHQQGREEEEEEEEKNRGSGIKTSH